MKNISKEPNIMVFTWQKYTALEKDIVALIVNQLDTGVNVNSDLFQNKTITVTAKMLNATLNFYHKMQRASKTLVSKQISIINDEKEEFDFITPFPRIRYKKGTLEITMLADVLPHFLELKKGYTQYYIKELLSLNTFNPKRLYEMLSSYKYRNSKIWNVYDDELKNFLGMESSKYRGRPKEFEQKIIAKSIDEINEKTSLNIEYSRGRDEQGWYTSFKILEIPKDEKTVLDLSKLTEKQERCKERLEMLGVKRKDLLQKIVLDKDLEAHFWQWWAKYQTIYKEFKNPAGVVLKELGLV